MNDLYKNEWSSYQNFFCPSSKLIRKTRIGGRIKKAYELPKTPYQRLLESSDVSTDKKQSLSKTYQSLNPFALKQEIERKIKHIFQAHRRTIQKPAA